jgi:hypothetical protein
LLAQTVSPPDCVHCDVDVHCAPSANPPDGVVPVVDPPQVPFTQ